MDPDLQIKKKLHDLLIICENVRDQYDFFCGCDTYDELKELLKSGRSFITYHGFEPSGKIDLQVLITILNIRTIFRNGGSMIVYIADYFAKLNKKLNGNTDLIHEIGIQYIQIVNHYLQKELNTNPSVLKFIWASTLINSDTGSYLSRIINISEHFTIQRIKNCSSIMDRHEEKFLDFNASQFLYPLMQCADIFELNKDNGGIQICQLGSDQRKINLLAREYADLIGQVKPIILSNNLLNMHSYTIYLSDTDQEIMDKIGATDDQYIYQYIHLILLRWFTSLSLCNHTYSDPELFNNDYIKMDKKQLKQDVYQYIIQIINPVRDLLNESTILESVITV